MKWIQLIVALSILVMIHELGHFLFAKLFKVRVEKFYMFFNPQISLFRAKKFGGKWHFKFFSKNVEPAAVEVIDPMTKEPKKDKKGNPILRPMSDEERMASPNVVRTIGAQSVMPRSNVRLCFILKQP